MHDADKTKDQLIAELTTLRQRIATLETANTERQQAEVSPNYTHELLHSISQIQSEFIEDADPKVPFDRQGRQHAEEALRESEQRYRTLVEMCLQGISIVTQDYIRVYANQALATMLGYEHPDDLIGVPVWDNVVPSSLDTLRRYGDARQRGEPVPTWYTYQRYKKDGTPIWIEQRLSPISWEGEDAYLATMVDVSDRKQAEAALQQAHEMLERRVTARTAALQRVNVHLQAEIAERQRVETTLRASEAHFGSLVQHASDIIALLTTDGMVQYYSPAMQQVLGYDPNTLIGRHIFGAFHPDDVPKVKRVIADLAQAPGTSQAVEYRVRHRDGSWRHFEAVASHPYDERSAGCLVVNARDITTRKQAEQALRASEELNRRIVEAMPGGIVQVSQEGGILHANAEAQRILGFTYDALTQRFVADFAPQTIWEDGSPCAVQDYPVTKCLATQQPQLATTIGVRRLDGTVAWAVFTAIPLSDPVTGQAMGAVVTFLDITERKQAEQERQRLEAQLRQMQKMDAMGTLAGGIAHEFNNILAAILGYTELVMLQVSPGSAVTQHLQSVRTAGLRAKALVQQILTFSRPYDENRKPIQVALVIQEVLKLLRASLPATIEIRQHIAPEVGMVLADATQLHQVFMNLCANAEYAMRETGGILEIRVGQIEIDTAGATWHHDLQPGLYVRVTVRDTGVGMSADTVERIFEPFFTTKGIGEGTGMGLAIVHGIVTSHGGAITVESQAGEGATFAIYLPRFTDTMPDAAVVSEHIISPGQGRILLVDDEEVLARLGQALLMRLGYEVEAYTESFAALKAFQAEPYQFDLVVTDQTMPVMTGATLVEELRHIRPDIPIILCTGFSHLMNAEKAEALGVDAFVMKPGVTQELAMTIKQVLEKRAQLGR